MALNGKKTTSLKNKIVLTSYLVKENCSNCINREQVLNVIKKRLASVEEGTLPISEKTLSFLFWEKTTFLRVRNTE